MSTSDIPQAEGPTEAGTRDIPLPQKPPPGRENFRPGSGTSSRPNKASPSEWVGCAPGVATMIAVIVGILLWIPCTYLVLPWIHEQTPLAYGVVTVGLVLLVLEIRQIGMGGFLLPKAPPASEPDQKA